MPDSQFSWPEFDLFYIVTLILGMAMVYLDFMPNTTSPILKWVLQLCGPTYLHLVVQILTGIHVIEALVSLYFTLIVGQGFFEPVHIIQWCLAVFIFGYPFLFALIPLAQRQQLAALAKKQKQQ